MRSKMGAETNKDTSGLDTQGSEEAEQVKGRDGHEVDRKKGRVELR